MSDLKHFLWKTFQNLNFMGTWCINSEKIIGKNDFDFPYYFKKVIFVKKNYNIDVLQQMACWVVNSIKVNGFACLFNCTTVGRVSE